MSNSTPATSASFGETLKFLRKRAYLTQRELGIAVGYSEAQITRLESDTRLPDPVMVKARFIDALGLTNEPRLSQQLFEKALHARATTHGTRQVSTNLPAQLTNFIGRECDIAKIKELLSKSRLITLIGAGGIGKTRLAQEFAATLLRLDEFDYGVWYVGLEALTDSASVLGFIAATLRLTEQPGYSLLETVADYFWGKQALLVLDNCEHLIDACADLVDRLLQRCPRLHILTTSREMLCINGEVVYRVPSLELPSDSHSTATLSHCESIQLFLDRARTSNPDFHLNLSNTQAVVQICCQLDGIPLAIEMAVARLGFLTPQQIVARLDNFLPFLSTGSRTAMSRHQTLRAAIEWSTSLLTPTESDFLTKLSVFEDEFTVEAVEDILKEPNSLTLL